MPLSYYGCDPFYLGEVYHFILIHGVTSDSIEERVRQVYSHLANVINSVSSQSALKNNVVHLH